MAEPVFLAGEWHERHDDWRQDVDLSTADRMTVYAAGRHDGYALAMSQFREMWQLLLQVDSTWTPNEVRAALEVADPKPFIATPPRRGHLRVVSA